MAEISLIDYIYEIEAMLDDGLADDALSHTWYILKHYPKYIKAYRLLGKALKIQSRYQEAIAVFQRLLSVLPDDVEAHRLLSVIYTEENLVQTAIYHAERAFEIQPADEDLREHLASLLQLRDGKKPQVRLTQPALVRLYLKDNQLEQASNDLERLLKDDPTRIDLLLLMAQITYQKKEFDEAYSLCVSLLEKIPFALEALFILAELLTQQGKLDEAQVYWQRMKELDPYDKRIPKTAEELLKGDSPMTWLEPLDPFPSSQETGWLETLAIPVSEVLFEQNADMLAGLLDEEPKEAVGEEEGDAMKDEFESPEPPQYSREMEEDILAISDLWTEEVSEGEKVEGKIADGSLAQSLEEAKKQEVVLPDWIYELAQVDGEKVKIEGESEPQEADWIKSLESVLSPTPEQSIEEETENEKQIEEPLDGQEETLISSETHAANNAELESGAYKLSYNLEEQPAASVEGERLPEELPEWLKELEEQPAASVEGERPSEELPEWLKELEEQPEASVEGERPSEELPEWLKELEEQPAASVEGERPSEELPEWLKELEEQPAASMEGERPSEELPKWLKELEEQPAASVEGERPSEELPEWLKELEEEIAKAEAIELPASVMGVEESEVTSDVAEEERPSEQAEGMGVELVSEEVPDWLMNAVAEEELEAPVLLQDEEISAKSPEELQIVDWTEKNVFEAEASQSIPALESDTGLPQWLDNIIESTASETAESQPVEEAVPRESVLPQWQMVDESSLLEEGEENELPQLQLSEPELPVSTFESVDAAISWLESVTQQEEDEGAVIGQEHGELAPTKPAKWILEKEVKEEEAQKVVHVSEFEKARTPLVINLNKASLKELESLPGVNFRLAQNIINYRQTHGKIRSIEELNRIPKLDTSQWKNIPIKVVLDDEEVKQPTQPAYLDETQAVIEQALDLMSEGYFEQAVAPLTELIRKRVQLEKVIAVLNKAIDHHPKEILLWQTLGDAYVRADRLKEAIRAYQRAEELLEG